MSSKRVIYFLLGAYLLGNVLLIFIQYNWAKNLNTLIAGNERLISEFTVSGQIKELERDILSVESGIRGAVNTTDTSFMSGIEQQMHAIEASLDKLRTASENDQSNQYLPVLERLVHAKLAYSRLLVHTYQSSGKAAAERLIATQRGKHLTDSILVTTRNIELTREQHLEAVTSSVDVSGTNALHLGIILISFVLVCGAFVFWYVINTIRRQNGLIYQLNLSERRVREAAKVKENFMANMSHEIRTPMNAILGFTNLLQRKRELDSESRQYVQTIQRSGENLLSIINDILDLSKIESGMMRIEVAPFSLRGLVHSLETMFRPKAAEKSLRLITTIDSSLPDTLEGDAVRLTQILVNLVGNAVKFTSEGSVAIKVEKERTGGDTIYVAFSVSDTGIGIEAGKLATIFERFQQAEGSVTRKYGGTGLGLSIARDLVQLQAGTIGVESKEGEGTTFRFTIPYRAAAIETSTADMEEMAALPERNLNGVKVLVVEDNEINQSLMKTIFRHWQVDCRIAGNGIEALQALESETFDVVLMDIQMPEMDGYTATQVIRNELKSHIPIIAMTAHAMAGEREKCLSYGMNEYLSKPVRDEQLYNLILQFTGKKPQEKSERVMNGTQAGNYRFIQLGYMREVSAGDVEYEKLVTDQFLELLPADLAALETTWQQNDLVRLRQIAHNMKTTVSVMGLDAVLRPYLDALEHGDLTGETFQKNYNPLKDYCEAAIGEAQAFYKTLS